MISTYIGSKLFNLLKKVVLNVYNTFNNNSINNNTILQANANAPCGILALLGATNFSTSSKFHAQKALSLKQEENLLAIVVQKLDNEQPHPWGCSRWASFQEYISELRVKRFYSEKWANRQYYRDVIMNELKERNIEDTSSVSSVVSSLL